MKKLSIILLSLLLIFSIVSCKAEPESEPEPTPTPSSIAVTGVTLNKTTASIVIKSTITLTATVAPENATNKAVTWSTSDVSKATVKDGVVTGVAAGKATITVTTVDGSKTATCEVTVSVPQAYGITYNLHNGVAPTGADANPAAYTEGVGVASFKAPTRDGYTFIGWFDAATEGNEVKSISATATGDKTLHAQWYVNGSRGNDGNGHNWIQLWLDGPKWAEFCVGATATSYANVTDYDKVGKYYKWKAFIEGSNGTANIGDTAASVWNNNWKMPTLVNFYNLLNKDNTGNDLFTPNTVWVWCDGKKAGDAGATATSKQYADGCTLAGWKVSGVGEDYSTNSIFLPAAGDINPTSGNNTSKGTDGGFWSENFTSPNAYLLYFNSTYNTKDKASAPTSVGYFVRPVFVDAD